MVVCCCSSLYSCFFHDKFKMEGISYVLYGSNLCQFFVCVHFSTCDLIKFNKPLIPGVNSTYVFFDFPFYRGATVSWIR